MPHGAAIQSVAGDADTWYMEVKSSCDISYIVCKICNSAGVLACLGVFNILQYAVCVIYTVYIRS